MRDDGAMQSVERMRRSADVGIHGFGCRNVRGTQRGPSVAWGAQQFSYIAAEELAHLTP
jgi:hypothetical protein